MRKKRNLYFWGGILAMILLSGLLCSCSNTRHICPAYDNHYKVEPLPY